MENVQTEFVKKEELRSLADAGGLARKAFEVLAQRQRKRSEISVEVLMRDTDASRPDVISLLRSLESVGCGKLRMGRGSRPTRFRWAYAIGSVARFALRQVDSLEPMPESVTEFANGGNHADGPDANSAGNGLADSTTGADGADVVGAPGSRIISYPYPLRPNLVVSVSLPVDMTVVEAERFGAFLRALAIAPHVDEDKNK